jgi:ribosomal protein S18 acetylase RimI-like enzyme
MIRTAVLSDLSRLVEIEERCFQGDRLSKRSFRHLINKGHAVVLVAEVEGVVAGNLVLLLNENTSLARIYSLAVDPDYRRQGLASALAQAAEIAAIDSGRFFLRLEVRADNTTAIRLYEERDYKRIGQWVHYYEDAADAVRMEKRLRVPLERSVTKVAYYEQTLSFTCGPAALMMAMHALDPETPLERSLELRLWREATTVFMTSGHGGTTPFGLALAAARRGFSESVYVSGPRPLFVDSVRSDDKKEVIALTEEDYLAEMAERGIPLYDEILTLEDLQTAMEQGAIPIVLISTWRLYRERSPHWVVVTGFDSRHVYLHDPWIDPEHEYSAVDRINIPLRQREFEKMARYGRAQTRITLLIHPPTANKQDRT